MTDLNWGEIIGIFITCAIKPGIAGIPFAIFVLKFNLTEVLLVCLPGGISGIFLFTFMIDGIIKIYNLFLDKYFPNRNKNKKKFTKTNRFIIKTKRNFGIVGIAAITPLFLSFPLGIFLSLKFFGDRKKTLIWMSIFMTAWTFVLYFVFKFFHGVFEPYFTN